MEPGPSDDRLPERGGTYGVPRLREQVLRRLAEAYSDNNLDLEEYERRVHRAQQARTVEQLRELIADFEGEAPVDVPARAPAGRTPSGAPGGAPEVFFALIGNRDISPEEITGDTVNTFSVLGDVRIDLSGLRPGQQVRVVSVSVIGNTRLVVPPGANVVRRFVTLVGSFKRRKVSAAAAGTPPATVIVEGFKLLGDVIVTEEAGRR